MEIEPKKPFIHKVRSLPEDQKKLIFFVIMGVCIISMAVFALWSTNRELANMPRAVQEINLEQ